MRVTDVRVWPVQGRHWPRFPMLFVEVYTDAGVVGLGESLCYQATGVLASIEQAGEYLSGRTRFGSSCTGRRCTAAGCTRRP